MHKMRNVHCCWNVTWIGTWFHKGFWQVCQKCSLPPGFLRSTNSPAFIGSPVSASISTTRQGCRSKASAARMRKASVVSPEPCGKWSTEIQLRVGGLGWWFRFRRFPKKSLQRSFLWPPFGRWRESEALNNPSTTNTKIP